MPSGGVSAADKGQTRDLLTLDHIGIPLKMIEINHISFLQAAEDHTPRLRLMPTTEKGLIYNNLPRRK